MVRTALAAAMSGVARSAISGTGRYTKIQKTMHSGRNVWLCMAQANDAPKAAASLSKISCHGCFCPEDAHVCLQR